jgi:hypothetical protein
MEIRWTDRVRNEVKEERKVLRTMKKRRANWIGQILRRNCFLKPIIEGKTQERIKVMRRRERIRKQVLDDLREMKGYLKLKKEALDRTLWRTGFGRGYGPVVRQNAE